MKKAIKDIIEMKNRRMSPFGNQYIWFFKNLENNAISKSDGTKRNLAIVAEFDKEAQAYICYQLFIMNESVASDLLDELKIKECFISNENMVHVVKNI